jgi:microcystin-dependent protein
VISIASNTKLYTLLGNQFGGSANKGTYGLPDLQGKAPTGLHYVICTKSGRFPARKSADRPATSVAQRSAASSVASSSAYGGSCNYLGQVVLVPFAFSFHGTVAARGELLPTSTYPALFMILGYTFGRSSNGQMFGVPDLRGQAPGGLHYRICTSGDYPSSQRPSSPWCNWRGQIILSTFNVSLRGTATARGQTLPILQNEALFALFSNKFGGSRSMSTFGLPDLRGKAPPGLHYRVCNSGAFPSRN